MKNTGLITEIFSSFQGEGLFVGKKQLFIRFFGCNLKCKFCDTEYPQNFKPFKISCNKLLQTIFKYNFSYHSISLTGGEPLLQADFIQQFLAKLRSKQKIYLDTNGTLPNELTKIIEQIDIIAMDFKLPSVAKTKDLFKKHREFLEKSKNKVFVKIVITNSTLKEDLIKAVKIIKEVDKKIPLVIQPVTPVKNIKSVSNSKIDSFYELGSKFLDDIRIIPQIHPHFNWK